MVDGEVVFRGDTGYDFYVIRKNIKDEYDIDRIKMPKAGASHRKLSDELVIGIPRSERSGSELNRKIISAYESLRGRK